ncbi:Transketolase, N-terminal section [hydrothermal vent metagenome]|uniref:Transketolase, N-terminal section n=1 Tax=hydrothermal vent metagenome TaxID=652676 RepID=A0A3B0QVP1_9ZZZZ
MTYLDFNINSMLKEKVVELRRHIVVMNCYAGSGHPGGALSAAEIVTYLFYNEMNFTPQNKDAPGRDRFILSKGHACMALYGVLAQRGFISTDEFKGLRRIGSMLQGHPDRLKTPGVEFNSGSLGQGFSFSLGVALGGKLKDEKFRVYTLLGDGELNEGQAWEGFMFGAHHKLDNLVAFIDYNKLQSDDSCENVTALAPLVDKLTAFGWNVVEINGHEFSAISAALTSARRAKGRPTVVVANTIKGKGISFMENDPKWHGSLAPQGEERAIALKECGYEGGDL